MDNMSSSVAIVIPIYSEELSQFEMISLENNLAKLQNHPIVFATPESFNLQNFLLNMSTLHGEYLQEKFPDQMFTSTMAYNKLMLSHAFYQRFNQYDFMLIAQLDTYVFSDELDYWCEKGFDYIGAPWFEGFQESTAVSPMKKNSGNGGFSLRKISSFLKVTKPTFRPVPTESWDDLWKKYRTMSYFAKAIRFQRITHRFLKPLGWYSNVLKNPIMNEDEIFANAVPRIFKWFKVASGVEAIPFAFDCQPTRLYEMNGRALPFGCHAWWRHDLDFWREFIAIPNTNYGLEWIQHIC